MNREQMLAWLALEGWQTHRCHHYGDITALLVNPGIWKPDEYYFLSDELRNVYPGNEGTIKNARQCSVPLDTLQDDHLKLLYEAVANQVP